MSEEKKKTQITKNEHFVPVAYLKSFSEDGIFTYAYDKKNVQLLKNHIPIDTICYEKNLYEDASGSVLPPNTIENSLKSFEDELPKFKKQLEKKTIKDNYKINCFLTLEEKSFWILFMVIQILRNPETLKYGQHFFDQFTEYEFSENDKKVFTLKQCLPLYEKFDIQQKNLFNDMLKKLKDSHFNVGVYEKDCLITCDNPVYCQINSEHIIEVMIMPITPQIAIFLYGGDNKRTHKRNILFPLTEKLIDAINQSMIFMSERWIYSKHPFSKDDISMISWVMEKVEEAIDLNNQDEQYK